MIFVIPAKAGIQMAEAKFAARNQVRIASDKSLPHSWGKARVGATRASAAMTLCEFGRKPAHI